MSWLALLTIVLQILKFFTQKAQEAGQLDAGGALAILKQADDINARVIAATAARDVERNRVRPATGDDPNNRDRDQQPPGM